jgi:hypothetical protein
VHCHRNSDAPVDLNNTSTNADVSKAGADSGVNNTNTNNTNSAISSNNQTSISGLSLNVPNATIGIATVAQMPLGPNADQPIPLPVSDFSTNDGQPSLQLAQNMNNVGTLVTSFKSGNLNVIGIYDFGGIRIVVNVGQRIAPPALAITSPLVQSGTRLNDN